jgi:hypothetical protein
VSNLSVNTITDASGGSTASINGLTPQASNMAGTNLQILMRTLLIGGRLILPMLVALGQLANKRLRLAKQMFQIIQITLCVLIVLPLGREPHLSSIR